MIQAFIEYKTSCFSEIGEFEFNEMVLYYFKYHGTIYYQHVSRPAVEQKRSETIALYLKRQHDEITGPLEVTLGQWRTIGDQYRHRSRFLLRHRDNTYIPTDDVLAMQDIVGYDLDGSGELWRSDGG